MNTGTLVGGELIVAAGTSTGICLSVNAEPLVTALITLGVSIVTIVGGEVVKFLVAFFQKKTKEIKEDTKDGKDKS